MADLQSNLCDFLGKYYVHDVERFHKKLSFVDTNTPTARSAGYAIDFNSTIIQFKNRAYLRYAYAFLTFDKATDANNDYALNTEWRIILNDEIISLGVCNTFHLFTPSGFYQVTPFFKMEFSYGDSLIYKSTITLNQNIGGVIPFRFAVIIHYGLSYE